MHPVLFTVGLPGVGLVEVSTYRAAYTVAALVAVLIAWGVATRRGLPSRRTLTALLVTAVSLPVGARLWHMATNWSIYSADPSRIWTLESTGHALFGGIALASIAGVIVTRLWSLDLWRLADAAAPGLAVGLAIMRVGCFSNGCCFGLPTNGPTGALFPPGSPPHLWQMANRGLGLFDAPLPVHPTQLYELTGALVCGLVAVVLMRMHAVDGTPFLAFIGLFAVVRWVNWGFRVPPPSLDHPEIYGPIYASVIAVCALLIVLRIRFSSRREGTD